MWLRILWLSSSFHYQCLLLHPPIQEERCSRHATLIRNHVSMIYFRYLSVQSGKEKKEEKILPLQHCSYNQILQTAWEEHWSESSYEPALAYLKFVWFCKIELNQAYLKLPERGSRWRYVWWSSGFGLIPSIAAARSDSRNSCDKTMGDNFFLFYNTPLLESLWAEAR